MALLALALIATDASAACSSFQPPPELYVGNMATDSACTHNDIQSAINAATCIYGTNIYITHEQSYALQHLVVSNKNVNLIGRVNGDVCGPASQVICNPTCPPPPTTPRAAISGRTGDAVLTVGGNSSVMLRYLDLNGGQQTSGSGGGIFFQGNGTLTLDTSSVHDNRARAGAGIYFQGTGATPSHLNLLGYSTVLANIALESGGGIYVGGNADLNALQPGIQISSNTAGANGGGIAVLGPASANIGSADSDVGVSVLMNNHAANGGGISIEGNPYSLSSFANGNAQARIFSTDSSKPVGIRSNTASHSGGAIYVKPKTIDPSTRNSASVFAWDYRIEGNTAVEGAAIYSDSDATMHQTLGADVWLGRSAGLPTDLGAVACTNSELCNTMNGNKATDVNQGTIVLIRESGNFVANRFSMRGNLAERVIRVDGDSVRVELINGLFADNNLRHEYLFQSGSNVHAVVNSCTFADGHKPAAPVKYVIRADSALTISDIIISEPDDLALDYSGIPADLTVNYVLSNDISTLPTGGTGIVLGVPTFVDAAGSDFHLKPGSLGVDFAPTSDSFYIDNLADLDGKPRNHDLSTVANSFGTQDLGAYELQNLFRECGASDSIFCNGYDHP